MADWISPLDLFLFFTTVLFAVLYRHQRRRVLEALGRDAGHPIPTVRLAEFHEAFATDDLGPTAKSEVFFIGKGDGVPGGTSDTEAWILSVLAKSATSMFEFGTCTGKTAYLWARNSAPDARIATLTLGPDQIECYTPSAEDDRSASCMARAESAFTRFRYTGTGVEDKITQLFGDSKAFDETPYAGRCDLVFVDGSHAYSYVKSDTEKALRMLAPGGILLWHDYGSGSSTRGVYRYLNELRRTLPLVRLRGTSIVVYRTANFEDR